MPVYSALLLAAAGFAAADQLAAMNIGEAILHNVTVAGPGAASFGVHSLSDGCRIGMTTCDVNNCMPLTGVCCGLGNGAYCDIGYACVDNGCCPVGKVCNGPPTGCEGDRDLCGEFCVPKGTCDGSGGGGSGGSGGSGGCPSGYEACDDECMPAGSVCCHNGYHCDAGQTCTSDFKCRLGGSSGGGGGSGGGSSSGGGDGGDDGPTSSIDDSFTSRGSGSGPLPTTYSLSPDPEPTAAPTESNPFGGGDDVFTSTEDSSQPTPTNKASTTPRPTSNGGSGGSSSNGGSNGDDGSDDDGNSNGGSGGAKNGDSSSSSSSDDDGSSGTMNAPSLIVGLLALIPFVL